MQVNVNVPYGPGMSPPFKAELAFFSKQTDALVFDRGPMIELYCRVGIKAICLHWTLARNLFKQPFRNGEAEALPANLFRFRIPVKGLHPGFYDLRVKVNTGTATPLEGICTFGWQPEKMAYRDTRPADFTAFWDQGKAELKKVKLAPRSGPTWLFAGKEIDEYNLAKASLPGDYDPTGHACEEVEVCKVDFGGIDGTRVHGWLTKPKGKGPFPAMLVLPGGGIGSRPIPLEHARHGYLALDINVHGLDVDQPKYDKVPGYYDSGVFEPPRAYYFRRLYLNALQAAYYLQSRPDVDPDRIVQVGGSQGGRIGIVVAGLGAPLRAAAPAIIHFAHLPYQKWAETCNAAMPLQDGMDRKDPPPLPDTPENRCLAYYDVMNFAPEITCPLLTNVGLVDLVSPPSCVYAVYNRLRTKIKKIVPMPGLSHDWSAAFDRYAWSWLAKQLKIKLPKTKKITA